MDAIRNVIQVTSDSFGDGEPIPKKHSGEGLNLSPRICWSKVPPGTKEFVLLLEDPDSYSGTFSHWLVYNIPPGIECLPESLEPTPKIPGPGEICQGKNSLGKIGYAGPLPTPGSGEHHYRFRVIALDKKLNLPPGVDKEDVQKEMVGHVIGYGELMGTYERR